MHVLIERRRLFALTTQEDKMNSPRPQPPGADAEAAPSTAEPLPVNAKGNEVAGDCRLYLELVTCTLLNPEFELEDFVRVVFPPLRLHCPLISIYSDARDRVRRSHP